MGMINKDKERRAKTDQATEEDQELEDLPSIGGAAMLDAKLQAARTALEHKFDAQIKAKAEEIKKVTEAGVTSEILEATPRIAAELKALQEKKQEELKALEEKYASLKRRYKFHEQQAQQAKNATNKRRRAPDATVTTPAPVTTPPVSAPPTPITAPHTAEKAPVVAPVVETPDATAADPNAGTSRAAMKAALLAELAEYRQ